MLATLIYQRNLKKTHYLNFNNIQFLLQNIESNNIFKTKITEFKINLSNQISEIYSLSYSIHWQEQEKSAG